MKQRYNGLMAAVFALGLAGSAGAGPAGDAVFATGVLDNINTNDVLEYTHMRTGPKSEEFLPITEGGVELKLGTREVDSRVVELTMKADGRVRQLDALPASAGNPILMAFMESSLRSMAKITGGSPFYIRNRMRSALRDSGELNDIKLTFEGREIDAQEAVFRPFDGDPNADSMGLFADLSIRFVISADIPGYFLSFSAETPEGDLGYAEEIHLISTGG